MNILAIDTATENCSAALFCNDKVYFRQEIAPQKHANLILPMIDAILLEAQIGKKDLDGIAFGHGPGSFTGVRIATSVAQGLALGLNLKVLGVSDLKAMSMESYLKVKDPDAIYVSSIDARMSEVYLGIYEIEDNKLVPLIEECVLSPQDAITLIEKHTDNKRVIGSGTGIKVLHESNFYKIDTLLVEFPDARSIIELARSEYDLFMDANNAQPVYLRNEVTWRKITDR